MQEQDTTSPIPLAPIIVPLTKAQRVRLARITAEITRWTQLRDEVGSAIVAGTVDTEALAAAGWSLLFKAESIVAVPPPLTAAPPAPPQSTGDMQDTPAPPSAST